MVIEVNIPGNEYPIHIGKGLLEQADKMFSLNRKVLLVSDDGVPTKYVKTLAKVCPNSTILILKQGDANKNLAQYEKVLSVLSDNAFTRKDALIAVGGGMVGDLAGFAAATYMRGIDFYNVPTTLLSQVDSSIGGKVAVNLNGIKNIVGAFYQPKGVLIDPLTLDSLDDRLFNEGLVEAIKMAATNDPELFAFIENSKDARADVEHIIEGALRIKKSVVEIDPRENGPRMVLNFGHTVGHAIETLGKGRYYHGEAVAMGMRYVISKEVEKRIMPLLSHLGLPVRDEFNAEELISIIRHDKKARDKGVNLCLLDELGKPRIELTSMQEMERRIRRIKENEE